ncbi:MAG: thermonuclease family protein [Elusimicrobiota bacterium]
MRSFCRLRRPSLLAVVMAGLLSAPDCLGAPIESLYGRELRLPAWTDYQPPEIGEAGPVASPRSITEGGTLPAEERFVGLVVRVYDGDTLTVMRDGENTKVRLAEIDTPEMSQAYGQEARDFSAGLALDKEVTIEVRAIDRYRRIVGVVLLADGRSLNRELIRAGAAWWYRHYSDDESLGDLEREAREAKRGLWAQEDPEPPWEYRRRRREFEAFDDPMEEPVRHAPLIPRPYCRVPGKDAQARHVSRL